MDECLHFFFGAYPLMSLMKNRYTGDGVVVETNHSHHSVVSFFSPVLFESNQLIKQLFQNVKAKREKVPTKIHIHRLIVVERQSSTIKLAKSENKRKKNNFRTKNHHLCYLIWIADSFGVIRLWNTISKNICV